MRDFVFNGLPSRVVFGAGSLSCLERELDALRIGRALVLSTAQQEKLAHRIADSLGERCAGVYPRAVMHVPIETARAAREEASRRNADCIIAAGGDPPSAWVRPSRWNLGFRSWPFRRPTPAVR